MSRADKQAAVAEIVDSFNDASGAVLTEYRGLSVKDLQELRRSLGTDAQYSVVKNTLAKLAASEVGITAFDDLLTGPTAIAFIKGDVVAAAKGLRDFAKTNPALVIKAGVLDGQALDAKDIAKLADLESREVLMAKLAGAMLASLSQAVYLLNAPLAQAARVMGALQAQVEQAEPAAESTEEPAAEAEPTEEPAAEAEPTEEPVAEAEPTDEPAAEAEPTEAPAAEAEPTEEPVAEAETTDEASGTEEASETSETSETSDTEA